MYILSCYPIHTYIYRTYVCLSNLLLCAYTRSMKRFQIMQYLPLIVLLGLCCVLFTSLANVSYLYACTYVYLYVTKLHKNKQIAKILTKNKKRSS